MDRGDGTTKSEDGSGSGDRSRSCAGQVTVKDQYVHMLEQGIRTDCTFIVGPDDAQQQEFHAHRFVISSASPVFEAMFESKMSEAVTGHVRVTDLTPRTFHLLLRHVYADEADIKTFEEARDLALAAHKYQMQPLLDVCVIRMRKSMTPDNVWSTFQLVRMIQHALLQQYCVQVLQWHTTKCIMAKDFLQLPEDCVALLLQQNELNVENEMVLVNAVVAWARCEAQRRGLPGDDASVRDVLKPRLLKLLRLLTLSPEQFALGPGLSEWLSDWEKDTITSCFITNKYTTLPDHVAKDTQMRRKAVPMTDNTSMVCQFDRPKSYPEEIFFNDLTYGVQPNCLFKTDNDISLLGIVVVSQEKIGDASKLANLSRSNSYREMFDVTVSKISLTRTKETVVSVNYAGIVEYKSTITIMFPAPVRVEKNTQFNIKASLRKPGFYTHTVSPAAFFRLDNVDLQFINKIDYYLKSVYPGFFKTLIYSI